MFRTLLVMSAVTAATLLSSAPEAHACMRAPQVTTVAMEPEVIVASAPDTTARPMTMMAVSTHRELMVARTGLRPQVTPAMRIFPRLARTAHVQVKR